MGEAEGEDVLLFAAGSAIAPIRALVQHLIGHRDRFGRVTLFYGQRHGAEFAYLGEHLDLGAPRGARRPLPLGADDAWQGLRGRVQEVARSLAFGGCPPGDAVAFVSGMTAMVEDVRRTLAAGGDPAGARPRELLRTEGCPRRHTRDVFSSRCSSSRSR